jgi:YggT family protein
MPVSLVGILGYFIQILQFVFLARLVAQLFDAQARNPITRFLLELTDPILAPIRRLMPATRGLDFSPTIVLVLLFFLQRFLVSSF